MEHGAYDMLYKMLNALYQWNKQGAYEASLCLPCFNIVSDPVFKRCICVCLSEFETIKYESLDSCVIVLQFHSHILWWSVQRQKDSQYLFNDIFIKSKQHLASISYSNGHFLMLCVKRMSANNNNNNKRFQQCCKYHVQSSMLMMKLVSIRYYERLDSSPLQNTHTHIRTNFHKVCDY